MDTTKLVLSVSKATNNFTDAKISYLTVYICINIIVILMQDLLDFQHEMLSFQKATFINVGRGNVVDEESLVTAIE